MNVFELDSIDIEGIVIPIKDDKLITVDRYGWELFKRYGGKNGWRTNFSVPHLHRIEYIGTDSKGKLQYKIILFYRELLGVSHYQQVLFWNRNKLDLRLANLYVRGLEQNDSYYNNILAVL